MTSARRARRIVRALPLSLFAFAPLAPLIVVACGPDPGVAGKGSAVPTATVTATTPPVPTAQGPRKPSIDEDALNKSVAPCDDFYEYACGGWLKATPIPDDQRAWGRSFSVIDEKNKDVLRAILEKDAGGKGEGEPYAKQLGDFYASCMDEAGIEKRGAGDLKDELARIDNVKDAKSLARAIAHLHEIGARAIFDFDSQIDAKDATQVIGGVSQGGLGLPERDYYYPKKDDTKKNEIRAFYETHVAAMLELSGEKASVAKKHAALVLKIETDLAGASMTNTELRDPQKIYNKLDRKGIKEIAPAIAWDEYFAALGEDKLTALNVAQPDFAKAASAMVKSMPIADWKPYLRWHLVRASATSLGSKFVDQDFKLQKVLSGVKKLQPRWKRCVGVTDAAMGEALAQPFVKQTLGTEGKASVKEMVAGLEAAMHENLEHLPWMDVETRKKALEKLGMIRNKIAFPDKWRSYEGLAIDRASYVQNRQRANVFESKRRLAKIGKPVDKDEWEMTPPTVNAYYEPTKNEIVFPAGILQPPMFGMAQTRAMNFGAIGMVIGHEITHGFDDEGRQFDAFGNLKEWWTKPVSDDFDKRAKCVEEQYDGYVAIDDMHVKGKLTLGENIADLGGLKIAYAALQKARAERPSSDNYAYTEDQQFFLGYAQSWCDNLRDEFLRLLVSTNPHSPPKFRVNGPLSNLPEFAAAFQCKAGSAMTRTPRCEVW